MKKNVVMIVNPISGAIDKAHFIEATALFAAQRNLNFVLYETSGNGDIPKIKNLYKKYKPDRIIIAGGDGTIKMVVDAIESQEVILGVLPAGSANGLATDLNLLGSLEENLITAFNHNYIEIDVIIINDSKSVHLSDIGLNAKLIKNYKEKRIRGKWGYVLQSFNLLKDIGEPFKATVTANGNTIEYEALMIVIANSKRYGTGVIINPNGKMNDGKFELVILKNLDLVVFGKIITGNIPLHSEDLIIISTDKATIKTNFPVSFQMDGEYCGEETELDIKISPQKIKFAVP